MLAIVTVQVGKVYILLNNPGTMLFCQKKLEIENGG